MQNIYVINGLCFGGASNTGDRVFESTPGRGGQGVFGGEHPWKGDRGDRVSLGGPLRDLPPPWGAPSGPPQLHLPLPSRVVSSN